VEEIRNMFCQIDAKITTVDKKIEKDAEEMKYLRQENERLERKIKEQDERLKMVEKEIRRNNLIIQRVADQEKTS
jgi:predicted  nucleic acid-binding Zn-ribbon protein